MLSTALLMIIVAASPTSLIQTPAKGQDNVLSRQEERQGFKLLFDGKSLTGWQGWQRKDPPKRWHIVDGLLMVGGEGDGGDIRTAEVYRDFEFRLDWKIQKGGNSGIMCRCTEDHDAPWQTGPEYQLLDDANAGDGKNPLTSAASVYALYAPSQKVVRPALEWNETRIILKGNRLEHWLNGVKVAEAEIGSADWVAKVKASKFNEMPDYGKRAEGHIAIQDHGYDVWFKNIRIRRL